MTLKLIGILLCIWMLTAVREIKSMKSRLDRLEKGAYKEGEE